MLASLLMVPGVALPLEVGGQAPDFTLPSTTGEQISLSQSLKVFARPRGEAHQQALDAARSPDEIEEADARYLLEGGDDPTIRARLAARYGKPVTWRGFFWNP
jgi:hypothetical protein